MKLVISSAGLVFSIIALTACTQNATINPNTNDMASASATNVALGMSLLQKGDVELAKSTLIEALNQDPKSSAALYSIAYFYEATGNETQADQYYQRAVKVDPKDAMANNNYGTFLCRHGKYNEAIQQFMIAVNNPNYVDTAEAYENAGLCALRIPNKVMAKGYLQKALANKPDLPASNLEMARLSYESGDKKSAAIYLQAYNKIAEPNAESRQLARRLQA